MQLSALTSMLALTASCVALGGCAAADPTGGLLGEPSDELIVAQQSLPLE